MRPSRARTALLAAGCVALVLAFALEPNHARSALGQVWSPFVLVTGLLLVGEVAAADGLFDWAAARSSRLPGGPRTLFIALMAVVAGVTVLLNLDTSVVFLTPILIRTARHRGLDEAPFLYGAVLMSNSASLLLPGSNLTNLIVLSGEHVSGARFLARMWPAWAVAVVLTVVVVGTAFRVALRTPERPGRQDAPRPRALGVVGVIGAAALVLALRRPAIPVLVFGAALLGVAALTRRLDPRLAIRTIDPVTLVGLFGVAVGLGTLARSWSSPSHLVGHASVWETAAVATVSAVGLNNLPAAVLLSSTPPAHPRALLLGLNLGPNLAVTGALSAILWLRIARASGARPSAVTYSKLGAILAPLSIAGGIVALRLLAPGGL